MIKTVSKIGLFVLLVAVVSAHNGNRGQNKCKIPSAIKNGGRADSSDSDGDSHSGSYDGSHRGKRHAYGNSGNRVCGCTDVAGVQVYGTGSTVIYERQFCRTCSNGQQPKRNDAFCINNPTNPICPTIATVPECVKSVVIYSCCVSEATTPTPTTTTTKAPAATTE